MGNIVSPRKNIPVGIRYHIVKVENMHTINIIETVSYINDCICIYIYAAIIINGKNNGGIYKSLVGGKQIKIM